MKTQNITLSVPKKVLMRFKEMAHWRQKSVSDLMIEMMEKAVTREEGYHASRERHLRLLEKGTDLNTHGNIKWKRCLSSGPP